MNIIKNLFKKNDIDISIIIPVYNSEKYLTECLDSLLNQSLKKIEIICIDDSSTDNSYSILLDYKNKDKRIRVFNQEHSNAGDARNIGIKKAKGKYLLFLDSDDFFEENLCQTAYYYADYSDADILLFGGYKYNDKTKIKDKLPGLLNIEYTPLNRIFSPAEVREHLYHLTSSAPWSKLFKKSFIVKNKILFQSLTNANDVYFTRISMTLAKKIFAVNEPLVYYRVNHGDSSQTTKHKDPLAFIRAYLKVKKTLEEKNLYNNYYQTYMNVLITEIVYNYTSTKTEEAKGRIKDYLLNRGLEELGIKTINEDLLYVKEKYEIYKEIIKQET